MSLKPLDRPHLSKDFFKKKSEYEAKTNGHIIAKQGSYDLPSSDRPSGFEMNRASIEAMKGPLGKKYE